MGGTQNCDYIAIQGGQDEVLSGMTKKTLNEPEEGKKGEKTGTSLLGYLTDTR